MKKLLNQMETKYRDPEAKSKIKQLKGDAQKQIERNRIILKDIITGYPFVKSVPLREDPLEKTTSMTTPSCSKEEQSTTTTSTEMHQALHPRKSPC